MSARSIARLTGWLKASGLKASPKLDRNSARSFGRMQLTLLAKALLFARSKRPEGLCCSCHPQKVQAVMLGKMPVVLIPGDERYFVIQTIDGRS